jgi:hypothetical protein
VSGSSVGVIGGAGRHGDPAIRPRFGYVSRGVTDSLEAVEDQVEPELEPTRFSEVGPQVPHDSSLCSGGPGALHRLSEF